MTEKKCGRRHREATSPARTKLVFVLYSLYYTIHKRLKEREIKSNIPLKGTVRRFYMRVFNLVDSLAATLDSMVSRISPSNSNSDRDRNREVGDDFAAAGWDKLINNVVDDSYDLRAQSRDRDMVWERRTTRIVHRAVHSTEMALVAREHALLFTHPVSIT